MIKKLCEISSPSGKEDALKEFIIETYKDKFDLYFEDMFSNLVFVKKGKGKRILIECGIDEPFLMVSSGRQKKLRFTAPPHFKAGDFVGKTMCFSDSECVKIKSEQDDKISYFDLYANGKEKRNIGEFVCEKVNFKEENNSFTAENLKYKLPVYLMFLLMDEIKNSPYEIYFLFSVQKCLSSRGLRAFLKNKINFDVAISLASIKESKDDYVKKGNGVVVLAKEKSAIPTEKIRRQIIKCAKENKIKHQIVLSSENFNSKVFINEGFGILYSNICIPYSDRQKASVSDLIDAKNLIISYLQGELS